MSTMQRTISPVDGSVYVERAYASALQVDAVLTKAAQAQAAWRHVSLAERAALCTRFVDAFVAKTDEIAPELSWQMGRPVGAVPGEVRGFEERARYMIEIAAEALADVQTQPKAGFTRFVRREPLGMVLTIAAWNYPYLIAVNSVANERPRGRLPVVRPAPLAHQPKARGECSMVPLVLIDS